MPKMDYRKLLGKIKEKGLTQKEMSQLLHCNESHFCRKLSGEYSFRQEEIGAMCEILGIKAREIGIYFFTQEVEEHQPPNGEHRVEEVKA